MVKVSPLSGITYNQDKLNIADVIAPPYDVISKDDQQALYDKSENNIVRLILGQKTPSNINCFCKLMKIV